MHTPPPSTRALWQMVRGALTPLVPLAYGAPGYHLARRGFEDPELDRDLRGRTALVTGANGGLGLATARGLTARGAHVVLACRSIERGQAAVDALLAEQPDASTSLEPVDMADPGSVTDLAARLVEAPLHVLIHNAAVLPPSWQAAPWGVELATATNLLGPHLLTRQLLPALHAAEDARVIHVSSGGMYTQRLSVEGLEPSPDARYDGAVAYARTKRALVVLNELWAQRPEARGIGFHAMHPGWADTPGVRSSLPRFHALTRSILRDARQGADTTLWLACTPAERLGTGGFWFDRRLATTTPLPGTRDPQGERERLWRWLEAKTARQGTDRSNFPTG